MHLHGKRHKSDRFYFRWHYGKQHLVQYTHQYIDKPTESQKTARKAFTELRKEVARQLKDEQLKAAWQSKFKADSKGYKFLHTYVYAQLKAGVTVTYRDVPVAHLPHPQSYRDAFLCASPNETQFHQHHPCKHYSRKESAQKSFPTDVAPIIMVWNNTLIPLFLPAEVPKKQ